MNAVYEAAKAGHLDGLLRREQGLTPRQKLEATLEILEGVEEFRRSLPWYRRWAYRLGSAIKDLREVL